MTGQPIKLHAATHLPGGSDPLEGVSGIQFNPATPATYGAHNVGQALSIETTDHQSGPDSAIHIKALSSIWLDASVQPSSMEGDGTIELDAGPQGMVLSVDTTLGGGETFQNQGMLLYTDSPSGGGNGGISLQVFGGSSGTPNDGISLETMDEGNGGVFIRAQDTGNGGLTLIASGGSNGITIETASGETGGITVNDNGTGGITIEGDGAGGIFIHENGDGGILIRDSGTEGVAIQEIHDGGITVTNDGNGDILIQGTGGTGHIFVQNGTTGTDINYAIISPYSATSGLFGIQLLPATGMNLALGNGGDGGITNSDTVVLITPNIEMWSYTTEPSTSTISGFNGCKLYLYDAGGGVVHLKVIFSDGTKVTLATN